jgi:hypothetical protein
MRRQSKFLCLISCLLIMLCPIVFLQVAAQSDTLTLRGEQHWDTYGVGGTCNHGTNNLYIADLDGDGVPEIVTGGFTYSMVNGSERNVQAPLQIWSWDGRNFTLEKNQEWPGSVECVYVADADGDGVNELFTAGSFRNDSDTYRSLRVWHWNGAELTLLAHYEGVFVDSIFVSDVDKDGVSEVITAGGSSQQTSQLCLWHFSGGNLVLRDCLQTGFANVSSVSSVAAADLDKDGNVEVATGGYSGRLNDSKGQVCVWGWNGTSLTLKANREWSMVTGSYAKNIAGGVLGNTVVYNLKIGDVDGDGNPEMVTGGFIYDNEKANAQLKVWSWNGSTLTTKDDAQWATDSITLVYCLSLADVDGDSQLEVAAGGMVAAYSSFKSNGTNPNQAQLTVWRWNGTALALQHTENWTIGEGVTVWNVGTADLDNNGAVEILTIGCMSFNRLCDPDMRVWSIENSAFISAIPMPLVLGALVAVVAVTGAVLYLRLRSLKTI